MSYIMRRQKAKAEERQKVKGKSVAENHFYLILFPPYLLLPFYFCLSLSIATSDALKPSFSQKPRLPRPARRTQVTPGSSPVKRSTSRRPSPRPRLSAATATIEM